MFQEKLFGEYVVKGQSWAVPFARSTPILYYNRDIFAKAGLPDRAPKTWSELRSWGPERRLAGIGRPTGCHHCE